MDFDTIALLLQCKQEAGGLSLSGRTATLSRVTAASGKCFARGIARGAGSAGAVLASPSSAAAMRPPKRVRIFLPTNEVTLGAAQRAAPFLFLDEPCSIIPARYSGTR